MRVSAPDRLFPSLATALLWTLGAGCGGGGPSLTVSPAMELVNGSLVAVSDGDHVSLERPPQGGHVLYAGAVVGGLDGGGMSSLQLSLRGRVRSAVDNSILIEDARTATFVPSPSDSTLWIPELATMSSVANIPLCPAYGVAMEDQTFILEVTVSDTSTFQTGTATRKVVPTCEQTEPDALALCRCECAANYKLGKCNTASDGGSGGSDGSASVLDGGWMADGGLVDGAAGGTD